MTDKFWPELPNREPLPYKPSFLIFYTVGGKFRFNLDHYLPIMEFVSDNTLAKIIRIEWEFSSGASTTRQLNELRLIRHVLMFDVWEFQEVELEIYHENQDMFEGDDRMFPAMIWDRTLKVYGKLID
jgi:hypothetical protein